MIDVFEDLIIAGQSYLYITIIWRPLIKKTQMVYVVYVIPQKRMENPSKA